MIVHPTRTNLLMLKERSAAVRGSVEIVRARRRALIREFLETTRPFLRSREEIRGMYGRALDSLAYSLGREGREFVDSAAASLDRDFSVEVREQSVWGLRYRDVVAHDTPLRTQDERGYDPLSATLRLEECIELCERVLDAVIGVAAYESRLRRLGDEIRKSTRRIRVLEERVLPGLETAMRSLAQYLNERERESQFRLKIFKQGERHGMGGTDALTPRRRREPEKG